MSRDFVPFKHPWEEKLVGEVAVVIVGGTPSTLMPLFWGGHIPWMASGDVHQRHIYDVPGRITELGLRCSNAVMVEPKAVAMALAGQGKTRGTVALTHIPVCTNQSVALIKPFLEKMDTDFLYQSLIPRYEEMRSRSAGGGRAGLTKAIIESVPIQIPPIPEQRKIARILTTLDNLIEKTEAVITKYQVIKQGVMLDLFTRGMNAHGNLRPTQVEAPDLYKQSELGWIPKEWEIRYLTDIASCQTGQPFPSDEYCDSGIRLLRPGNLPIDEYVRWDSAHTTFLPLRWESLAAEYLVSSGEVVMNLTAQSLEDQFLGRVCVTPPGTHCLLNQRLARFRSKKCHLPFLFWAFKGPHFRFHIDRLTQGTKVQHIYNANLNSARLAVPDDESEQTRIADILFSATRTVRAEQTQLYNLKQHKTGLMQDLLTGKVRVKVDDPEEVAAHE